eukprot:9312-Heterocapsa_arctica.AAC.1
MPLWCGLVARLIKPGSEEYKSAKRQKAQDDERLKIEGQNVWDPESVREWSSVARDPNLEEAAVAHLFVIMGRMGEEMAQTAGAESEVKYKARWVYAGSNIQGKATPAAMSCFRKSR